VLSLVADWHWIALSPAGALGITEGFRTTWSKWQLGAVIPVLAGVWPVMMLARVGEHSGLAA
jgi:hypothetical protein